MQGVQRPAQGHTTISALRTEPRFSASQTRGFSPTSSQVIVLVSKVLSVQIGAANSLGI